MGTKILDADKPRTSESESTGTIVAGACFVALLVLGLCWHSYSTFMEVVNKAPKTDVIWSKTLVEGHEYLIFRHEDASLATAVHSASCQCREVEKR